jgi:hypothetical protein
MLDINNYAKMRCWLHCRPLLQDGTQFSSKMVGSTTDSQWMRDQKFAARLTGHDAHQEKLSRFNKHIHMDDMHDNTRQMHDINNCVTTG